MRGRGGLIVVRITNIDDLKKYRIGFGTLIKKDGATDPTRILNLTDIVEIEDNKPKIVDGKFVFAPFELMNEKDVAGRIYEPTTHDTALAHIFETLNATGNVDTAGKDLSKGLIKDLKDGGKGTQNYENFDVFSSKPRPGITFSNKNRSQAKFLPIANNIDTSLSKYTDSLTKKQKEELGKRFGEFGKVTPLNGDLKKPVVSTPIVHYYQSRYIASMLLEKAEQVVATNSDDLRSISRLTENEVALISKAINLSPDVRTEVDQIFDMYPIGTTVRFRNKDVPANGAEDLMNEGNHIDIGILQRMYALYNTSKRNKFKENVAEIIKTLPTTEKHSKGNRIYYSIDSKILESVLVWINDTEYSPPPKAKKLKMLEFISDETEQLASVTVPMNSIIEMPGWMLFEYSNDNGKSLMKLFSDDFSGEWRYRHEMIALLDETMDDDENIDEAIYRMESFASENIIGSITEITGDEITLELDLSFIDSVEPESMRVRMDRSRLFDNELERQEKDALKNKFMGGNRNLPTNLGLKSTRGTFPEKDEDEEDIDGIPQNPIAPWEKVFETDFEAYGVGYADERGFKAFAQRESEGVELAYPRIYELNEGRVESDFQESRAFHALGEILMYLISKNAIDAAIKYQSESVFDRVVAGLLGTYGKPGAASYHAQLHHELLKDMTRDAFSQANDEKGLVSLGASLIFEQYSNNPSKLMVMWMLANFRLIDMGGIDEKGQPSFFTIPQTDFDMKAKEADLMNIMAMIIISYYRLAFYPLRLRGNTGNKSSQFTSKNWTNLQKDANSDPPEPYAFAAVLRFLSKSKQKLSVEIPAWMPGLPKNFAGLDRARSKKEVSEYISWAYGSNPTSKEHFCEIAAAYHAAKALSYYEPGRYAEMMQKFVEAVEAERGEGFLISVLIAYNKKEKLPTQTKSMEGVLEGADIQTIQTIDGGKLS